MKGKNNQSPKQKNKTQRGLNETNKASDIEKKRGKEGGGKKSKCDS